MYLLFNLQKTKTFLEFF